MTKKFHNQILISMKKFLLILLLIGAFITNVNAQSNVSENSFIKDKISINIGGGSLFSFNAGGGIGFNITKSFGLFFELNYSNLFLTTHKYGFIFRF